MGQRAKPSHEVRVARPHHDELALCAKALSVPAKVCRRKGPYLVDLHVPLPASSAGKANGLALDLVAEAEICPLTSELLGPTRMRQRQLAQMRWTYLGLSRKEWMALPSSEARVAVLEGLLSR